MQSAAFLKAALLGTALAAGTAGVASADCVRMTNIHSYTVIDSTHFVLNGGANDHYLVTTASRCPDAAFGIRLGTSFGPNETVCSPFIEYLVSDDGWRCPIDSIVEVESLDEAEELAGGVAVSDDERYVPGGTDDIYEETNEG